MSDANNNDDEGGDAEKMRLAFEAFMLKGKKPAAEEKNDESTTTLATSSKSKKKKKKKKSMIGTPPKPTSASSKENSDSMKPSPMHRQSTKSKADRKRYYQLLRSFNDKVQHTWLDIDNQMLSILQNIVSIRGRLPLEWKVLQSSNLKQDNPEDSGDLDNNDRDDWKYCGLLGKPKEVPYSFHLHVSDVQLALSNDLKQHEKMLMALRSFMSNLAECHDSLGRVVDNFWKFHLECTEEEGEEGQQDDGWMNNEDDGMENIVQNATNVFQMLSMELYRKQSLVPLIIESTEDEILGIEKQASSAGDVRGHGEGSVGPVGRDGNTLSGVQTARKCCKSWQRSSDESCIDESLISHVMKLGEISQQNNN